MTGTLYLFATFSITWLIIFLYIFSISRRQKALEREIEKLSEALEKLQ
jgi:CcmD family protein